MDKLNWLSGDDLNIWYCLGYIDKQLFLELWKKDPNTLINWYDWELDEIANIDQIKHGYMTEADEDEKPGEYDKYYIFHKQNEVTEENIKSGFYQQVTYLIID